MFADRAYNKSFNVSIIQYGTPSLDTVTGLSTCNTGTDRHCKDEFCGGDTVHCKNLSVICHQLESSRTIGNQISVLWTHRGENYYCKTDEGHEEIDGTINGACYPGTAGILMMKQVGSTDEAKISFMSIVLAHELAHVFGFAEDKYYRDSHQEDGWQCVMEAMHSEEEVRWRYYQDVLAMKKNAFCPDCKSEFDLFLPEFPLDLES